VIVGGASAPRSDDRQVGAQRRRLVNATSATIEAPTLHSTPRFLAQLRRARAMDSLSQQATLPPALPQAAAGGPRTLGTSNKEHEITAPATTIWFGHARDGIRRFIRLGNSRGKQLVERWEVAAIGVGRREASGGISGRLHHLYRGQWAAGGAAES